MLRRLTWLLALPTLVLALVTGVAVGPANAAYEHEFLTGYGQLVPLPAPVTPPQQCTTRQLHLNPGTYAWTLSTPGGYAPSEDIQVQDGDYTWSICVFPRATMWGAFTRLSKVGGGAYWERQTSFDISRTYTYYWESMLYNWGPLK
ncbi:hypothetical protein ABZW10_16490 [Kitasatospora sp. NPDC004723]|uniref:hypothetical protein n=1 Tax=Kitasatospora sp. NPDC004723 TaxID=3154288 RepID=UPI0033A633B4